MKTKRSLTEREMLIEELKWKKFNCLDDGFICLVDVMGSDQAIVQAARVSYGEGTKKTSDDRTLIRYLFRHRHTTPFEMAEVKFLVRCPMDLWRQWIRHRTANVNEYSTRYSLAIDSAQKTDPGEWRRQAETNRQGSSGLIADGPPIQQMIAKSLSELEVSFHEDARELYNHRIEAGVAREQARKDLPLSTYTEAYWKCDLHNILHFLGLRMDEHAQQEIREYATAMGEQIMAPLFPLVWEAFQDYRLGGMFLSRLDLQVIHNLQTEMQFFQDRCPQDEFVPEPGDWGKDDYDLPYSVEFFNSMHGIEEWSSLQKCRERDECLAKLQRMGLVKGGE